jgi:hypothetical protein
VYNRKKEKKGVFRLAVGIKCVDGERFEGEWVNGGRNGRSPGEKRRLSEGQLTLAPLATASLKCARPFMLPVALVPFRRESIPSGPFHGKKE